ncbi:glycerophosphodiester phosphodiesterase family protein [Paracoccaceae bacterium GXU_MW_L88]
MPDLPQAFFARPLAHRGLHDRAQGRIENSPAAFAAAIDAGYGIELDLQLSADGEAMVFHDDELGRLTAETGRVRDRNADALTQIRLKDSEDTIPTLEAVLAQVAGQVPLLIEIKDQDGALGEMVGPLEARVAALLKTYDGPVAVMSFNPHSIAAMAEAAPEIPRGLVTCGFHPGNWRGVPEARLEALREIPDFDRVGASFISHDHKDLDRPRVAEIAKTHPVLCWTIRSAAEEERARRIVSNITFEGYRP